MKLWPFTRPSPQPLRAIVATRSESMAVARQREATTQALRRYVVEKQLLEAVERAVKP